MVGDVGTGWSWLRIGKVAGTCEFVDDLWLPKMRVIA